MICSPRIDGEEYLIGSVAIEHLIGYAPDRIANTKLFAVLVKQPSSSRTIVLQLTSPTSRTYSAPVTACQVRSGQSDERRESNRAFKTGQSSEQPFRTEILKIQARPG